MRLLVVLALLVAGCCVTEPPPEPAPWPRSYERWLLERSLPRRRTPKLDPALYGVHPETATRIDLDSLARFELERLEAPEDVYCFHARCREVPADERIFTMVDFRSGSLFEGLEAKLDGRCLEHAFHQAIRSMRAALAAHDPRGRLRWNRLVVCVTPELMVETGELEALLRRLAPSMHPLPRV